MKLYDLINAYLFFLISIEKYAFIENLPIKNLITFNNLNDLMISNDYFLNSKNSKDKLLLNRISKNLVDFSIKNNSQKYELNNLNLTTIITINKPLNIIESKKKIDIKKFSKMKNKESNNNVSGFEIVKNEQNKSDENLDRNENMSYSEKYIYYNYSDFHNISKYLLNYRLKSKHEIIDLDKPEVSKDISNTYKLKDKNDVSEEKTGLLGFCLIKYDNYLIDLNLIKRKENNFHIKNTDGVVDFSICNNVESYDETKRGLFLNRVKNIAYAGDGDTEKFFMINTFNDSNIHNISYKKSRKLLKEDRNKTKSKFNQLNMKNIVINKFKKKNYQHREHLFGDTNKHQKPLFKNILIYLPQGDNCTDYSVNGKNPKYTIIYELTCDPHADKAKITNEYEFNPASCFNKINISTRYICPEYLKKFISWYDRFFINKYILLCLITIKSIFLILFGRLQLKISMCLSIILLSYFLLSSYSIIDGKTDFKNIGMI